ncbi:MAG: endolytic transglycosylase MltG [Spirochaetia bacterium]|nr:endolytic transglycosylase MltG [Spirochaetia bacterium]
MFQGRNKYILITGVLSFVLLSFIYIVSLNAPAGDGAAIKDFVIKDGWGAKITSNKLKEKNLIQSSFFFEIVLFFSGNRNNIKKGIFSLNDGMSTYEIIGILSSGKTKTVQLTIPEGYNNRQIADVLIQKGFVDSRKEFLSIAAEKKLLKEYNIKANDVEGYLFPETYTVPIGYPVERIIRVMIDTFFEKTGEIEGFPQDSKEMQKTVILASIIEREAKLKEERPIIAGVFANRLKENYPLESCATIQYLFEKPKKRLLFKHLEIKSPYNTYRKAGLPPGPISNPGLAAIKAAVSPADTNYKFFVVKKDGSHHFSETFNQHVKAKKFEHLH